MSISEMSKRRTKTVINTVNPQWNQSFVYSNVRPEDLRFRVLEVTVWDYDRFGANEFLGEVCIDLGMIPTSATMGQPLWHPLNPVQSAAPYGWDQMVSRGGTEK